jgi:hypothetical protein
MAASTELQNTPRITSVEAFVAVITQLAPTFGLHAWFRGQSDASWTLRPSVTRVARNKGHEPNRSIHFMNRARTRYPNCPAADDLPGWLFLMQHYGLHTRLLDWTEAPLVALYFAVETDANVDAAVYVLDPHKLNQVHGRFPGVMLPYNENAKKLISPAFKTGDYAADVAAILPPEMDYRMLLQRSVFTVHGDSSPLESHAKATEFLAQMLVPKERRTAIRNQLAHLGVDRAHLFPDLSNLATFLNAGTGSASP